MRWIIGSGKDIVGDNNQLSARRNYINLVTGADVSEWTYLKVNGHILNNFLCCVSFDDVDGTFITAHMQKNNFPFLCSLSAINKGKFIVANTCILEKLFDKRLLYALMSTNRNIELFFAKQELFVDSHRLFWKTATINNFGEFGFQTSLSERKMFKNRHKGLLTSIRESFVHVSPILFLEDI